MKSRILKKFILVEALFFLGILICVEGIASTVSDSLSSLTKMIDSCRTTMDLSGNWKLKLTDSKEMIKFSNDDGVINGYWKKDYDASSWKNVKVPHNWFWDGLSRADCTVGWYQKKVVIPKEYQGNRLLIRFEGISYESDIWVNGEKVGNYKSTYPSTFEFDVTEYIDWGVSNVITVRCSFYPAGRPLVPFPNPVRGRAGIYLKPTVIIVPDTYIQNIFINPKVSSSEINVEYWVISADKNTKTFRLAGSVIPFSGKGTETKEDLGLVTICPGLNKLQFKMKLKDPAHWFPDNPYLYNLFLMLKDKNKVVDCVRTRFGFREFTIDGNVFCLNGKPVMLFGTETIGVWTSAVGNMRWAGGGLTEENERNATRDLFIKTKENGVNMLRGWYAGPSPSYVYEIADEVGLFYYEEWGTAYPEYAGKSCHDSEVIKQQTEEMKVWIHRNWNSPSVVMLSFFNENWGDYELSNKLYDILKPEVEDRLFLCASSGMLSFPGVGGPVKTDFIDMHNYTGDSIGCMPASHKLPWTYMEDSINEAWNWVIKAYGDDPNKPLIIGECPNNALLGGFDGKAIAPDGKVTPESYVKAAAIPNMGYNLESNGLREAISYFYADVFPDLVPGAPLYKERDNKVKRGVESLRRMERIRGIDVNNFGPPSIAKTVYKPTFICSSIFDTNLFSGDSLTMDLYLINDSIDDYKNVRIIVEIISRDGKKMNSNNIRFGNLKGSSRKKIPYTYKIPDNFSTGIYDIKLYLYSDEKLISGNYYDFYVLNRNELKPVATDKNVSILFVPGNDESVTLTSEMLKTMTVKYKLLYVSKGIDNLLSELNQADILIIPAFYDEKINNWLELDSNMEIIGKAIRNWVESGKKLLFMEQNIKKPLPWVREWKIIDAGSNSFMDMAIPEHPVYSGIVQRNFDTWSDKGVNTRFLISPMSVNVLGSVAANSNDELAMAIAETKVGKGLIIGSQLLATKRFMKDSCATKYLYNLYYYVFGNKVYADARGLTGQKEKNYSIDLDKCFYVDLKPYVNMGFKDEVDGDKQGGWSDQGENDLRHIPVADDNPEKKYWQLIYRQEMKDKQVFLGVPFAVIDPEKNDDKSCIVLAGSQRPYFPTEVKDIKVNNTASKLYFLHTAVWCTGGSIGKYIIHYSDGTEGVINLTGGKNINDWWGPKDIEEAPVAWAKEHPVTGQYVGVYLMEWENPYPDKIINSIDFVSSNVAVPILLAITGVK